MLIFKRQRNLIYTNRTLFAFKSKKLVAVSAQIFNQLMFKSTDSTLIVSHHYIIPVLLSLEITLPCIA